MELRVGTGSIQEAAADAVVVSLFEGVAEPGGATGAVDAAMDGAIRACIGTGDATGELGRVTVLYPRGAVKAERVVIVGLGARASFDAEAARRASGAAIRACTKRKVRTVATVAHGAGAGGLDAAVAAQATLEGAALAAYRYDDGATDRRPRLDEVVVVEHDASQSAAMEGGARAASAFAAGATLARDLVNGPPNVVTPSRMAQAARAVAEDHGLRVHVGDRAWMEEQAMGALLAVARGAAEEPAFVTIEHGADRADEAPLVLVGKGITFDSGGLSLKSRTGMISMKNDMGGAAAVLGAMRTIAMLGVPRRVIGLLACTENMPGGRAYRPSDVVRAGNGTTIEIVSTDAEGRLALADALVHAARYEPAAVIDVATLTGSAVRALGEGVAAAMFSNDDRVAARLEAAADTTHERVWRLPLFEDYRRKIDSDVADMKNSGGAKGGVGTSAVFLQEFVSAPWAHVDIAGVVVASRAKGYGAKGATGFGVRLLAEAVRTWDT